MGERIKEEKLMKKKSIKTIKREIIQILTIGTN